MDRLEFLKRAGLFALAAGPAPGRGWKKSGVRNVSIVAPPGRATASMGTVNVSLKGAGAALAISWGARMDGQFYQDKGYAPSSTDDAPWACGDATPNAFSLFTAHAGKQPVFVQWGGSASAWPPVAFDTVAGADAWNAGLLSMYDWGTSVTGLNDLLANNSTAWTNLGTLATAIKTYAHPVLFRPLWEMNGNWFNWGRQNYTSSQYVTMWRNLWQIFADVMGGHAAGSGLGTDTGNATFFWCPNDMLGEPDPTANFPGVAYVDVVGADAYNKNDSNSPSTLFTPVLNVCRTVAPGKPIFIGETGCEAPTSYPGGKTQWVDDFFAYIKLNPDIKGFSWFNETGNPTNPHIEVGPLASDLGGVTQTHWHTGIGDAYYRAGGTGYVNATNFPNGTKVTF